MASESVSSAEQALIDRLEVSMQLISILLTLFLHTFSHGDGLVIAIGARVCKAVCTTVSCPAPYTDNLTSSELLLELTSSSVVCHNFPHWSPTVLTSSIDLFLS